MEKNRQALIIRRIALVVVWLIGLCVIWELEKLINFRGAKKFDNWIHIFEWALVPVTLCLVLMRSGFRGNLWYWILPLGLMFLVMSSFLRSAEAFEKSKPYFLTGAVVYLLCPAIGLLAEADSLKKFLKAFIAVWIIIYAGFSIVSVYCISHGIKLYDISRKFHIGLNRFNALIIMDRHQNITASMQTVSILMAVLGSSLSRHKVVRILYLLAILPMYICLAMTGSRAGEFGTYIGIGLAAAAVLQKPLAVRLKRTWLRVLLSFLLIAVILVSGLLVNLAAQKAINTYIIAEDRPSLLSTAYAEEADENEPGSGESESVSEIKLQKIRERRFLQENFFMGRLAIWESAINALKAKPSLLLTGTSIPTMKKDIAESAGHFPAVAHLHNLPMQILLETGLGGFIVCVLFLILLARATWKVLFSMSLPNWKKLVMPPAISLVAISFVDCVCRLPTKAPLKFLMLIFAGLTLVVAKSLNEKKSVG